MNTKLTAGRLRRLINIEERQQQQDPVTGEIQTVWVPVAEKVPAAIEALSAREYIAAQATTATIQARIIIRFRPGMNAAMRFIADDGTIYNPHGFLPDLNSGREFLTIPSSTC